MGFSLMGTRSILILIVALVVLVVGYNSGYIVKETGRAVLLTFGKLDTANIDPGLDFKWPLVQEVRKFDARVLTFDAQPERFLTVEKNKGETGKRRPKMKR